MARLGRSVSRSASFSSRPIRSPSVRCARCACSLAFRSCAAAVVVVVVEAEAANPHYNRTHLCHRLHDMK